MTPRILDLFCGAGGCSVGYARAGFEVVGVDLHPQPNYPYEFIQQDALEMLRDSVHALGAVLSVDFDAIHASPPCQHYAGVTAWRGDREDHPDLIAPTRELLIATGLPYVIENVQDARRELINPIRMCGSQFGLAVRRHRYFETNWPLSIMALGCHHKRSDKPFMHKGERAYADAMGCEWMTNREARQAVPPAYTGLIGLQLAQYLNTKTAA